METQVCLRVRVAPSVLSASALLSVRAHNEVRLALNDKSAFPLHHLHRAIISPVGGAMKPCHALLQSPHRGRRLPRSKGWRRDPANNGGPDRLLRGSLWIWTPTQQEEVPRTRTPNLRKDRRQFDDLDKVTILDHRRGGCGNITAAAKLLDLPAQRECLLFSRSKSSRPAMQPRPPF